MVISQDGWCRVQPTTFNLLAAAQLMQIEHDAVAAICRKNRKSIDLCHTYCWIF